jgi:hypothetical protein
MQYYQNMKINCWSHYSLKNIEVGNICIILFRKNTGPHGTAIGIFRIRIQPFQKRLNPDSRKTVLIICHF